MDANDNCIFCKILQGEIPSYPVYKDENYTAFLDIAQFARGHTVVIPNKHTHFVWDSEDIGGYYATVQKIANHYRSLGYKFVDSMIFGRMVPHAHVHLIPHNGDDEDLNKALAEIGNMQKDPTRRPTPEEGKKLVEEFRVR